MLPLLKVDFNPVAEFTDFVHNPYVNLPLGLDINKAVVYMWMAALLATLLTLVAVRRSLKVRPDGRQAAAEIIYDVATLFVFIWMMNVIGFIPLPFGDRHFDLAGLSIPEFQIYAATANLSVTLALTLVTFFATHIEGIRYNGVIPYFRSWVPSDTPWWILPIMIPVEVISQFVRIVSLSFRLFFNLLAGHLVIAVFLGLASLLGTYFILPIGIPMGVALYLLECTLIAGLQAFIFATLSAIYIGGAIHPDH
jgi:F-type H+-transporting ATPase subunit a